MKKKTRKVFRIVAEVWIEPNAESNKYLKAVIKERIETGDCFNPIIGEDQDTCPQYKWSIKPIKISPLALKIK